MQLLSLKNILVATDLDQASSAAVLTASTLAGAAGACLHAVFVAATQGPRGEGVLPTAEPKTALLEMLGRAAAPIEPANAHVLGGDPAYAISALADRLHADVIVLGPHRAPRDAQRARALGGTALAVVTTASAPCLIASQPLALPLERVLVPIDLSDTARGALLVGLSWASALRGGARRGGESGGATLTALNIHSPHRGRNQEPGTEALEKELEFVRAEAGGWAGVSIQGATAANADVAEGIAGYASDHRPDLVVIGTRGLGLDSSGRLGSIAAAVTQRLPLPTLLVPPAIWTAHMAAS